ncbi:MAG: ABC transporter ATP-binding protein [Mycoplasma sp.]|nr:ABC transporter ATP-binding protein [Mycoplasma sp.]
MSKENLAIKPDENKKILSIRDLNISFKNGKQLVDIIRGIDLDVFESQIIGLVGESGSGKSVSTKSLLNLNKNSITNSKRMLVDGVNLMKMNRKKWLDIRGKKIAYIPQDPMTSLNPTRTIKKQLLDTLIKNRPDLKTTREREMLIVETLEKFGIREVVNKLDSFPHTFSGGMKQRIVIASAVMCKPKLIIADEPTTALDTVVQASVLNLFLKVRDEFNVSIIFISHDIGVIAKLCDYIYVMYAGKVVEKGKKKEIFTDPRHPYTWALLSAIPDSDQEELYTIPGSPPNMKYLPMGDPFAPRNKYATKLDFLKEPPLIDISNSHAAATWLLHPNAPKVKMSKVVKEKIKKFKEVFK